MKKRLAVAAVVMALALAFFLPMIAVGFHALLTRHVELFSWNPIICWQLLLQELQIRSLYLLFAGTMALMLLWAVISSSSLKYRSNMNYITPEISTPCAAGQGQYGTAKWMPEKAFDKHFATCALSSVPNLQELVEAGIQDRKEIDA